MSIGKTNSIGGSYQKKTITPYNFVKNVLPDANYNALSEVEIDGVLVDPHIPIESVQDNTTKYQKVIPNKVLTYGGLSKLGGLTKKYNQLIQNGDFVNTGYWTTSGCSFSVNNNVAHLVSTVTDPFGFCIYKNITYISNHKYLAIVDFGDNNNIEVGVSFNNGSFNVLFGNYSMIDKNKTLYCCFTISNPDAYDQLQLRCFGSNVDDYFDVSNVRLIDLTTIYGAGNEPTTVDQFLTDYPKFSNYVPYTTGAMDYAYTKKVDITGFNIWDEEWVVGVLDSDGTINESAADRRTTDFIRVIPNSIYYQFGPAQSYSGRIAYYDINKQLISYDGNGIPYATKMFTTPSNCAYVRVSFNITYGTTYNHDICINVSNASLNGTYKQSYRNALLEAKIVAIKQKLVSLGYSADVLGYGLDNVYNYIDLENKQVVLNMGGYTFTGNENWVQSAHCYIMQDVLPNVKLPLTPNYYWKANILFAKLITSSWQSLSDGSHTSGIALTFDEGKVVISENDYTNISSLTGQTLLYELATPITIDVSDILDNDDVIGELESGGTITFENDEKYNLPSNVTYLVEVE